MQYKINESIRIRYLAINLEEGLTDLILTPTNPNGVDQTPIILSEIGDGLYEATFIPDLIGWWWVRISSVSKPTNIYSKNYFVGTEYTTYPPQEDGKLNSIDTKVGEIQESPTQYTLLDRLKKLFDKLVELFETGIAKIKLWDGIEVANVTSDNKLETITHGRGKCSTLNSTETPLVAGETFIGQWESILDYAHINILVFSDQDSAIDGLVIEWSCDGVNVDETDNFTIKANNGKIFSFGALGTHYRIKYTNNSLYPQNVFRLLLMLKCFSQKPSSHRIKDEVVGEDDAELVKAILTGAYNSEYKNVKVTADGRLLVSAAPTGIKLTNEFYWENNNISPLVSDAWYKVLNYTVPNGYNLECINFNTWASNSTSSARVCLEKNFGSFNHNTQIFTDNGSWTLPKFSAQLFAEVTTVTSGGVTLTITYTNRAGVTGRTATVTIPNNTPAKRMYQLTLQSEDIGVIDVTNITSDVPGAAGITTIYGKTELFYEKMTVSGQNYTQIAARESIIINEGDILSLEFTSSQTANAARRISLLGTLVPV